MQLTRYFARFIHDGIAHPLIAISGGSKWSHRFHDWIGVIWASPDPKRSLVIRGEYPYVGMAASILEKNGFQIIDSMHDVAHVVSPKDRDAILLVAK